MEAGFRGSARNDLFMRHYTLPVKGNAMPARLDSPGTIPYSA